jgi:hypothetical protein
MDRPSTRIEKPLKLILHISTVTIVAGVFLPLAEVPVNDEVTYNEIAATRSYFLVAFALAGSLILSFWRRDMVWLAALGIWLTLLLPAIKERLWPESRGTVEAAFDTVTGPFRNLATDFYMHLTDLRYGGVILVLGCAVFAIESLVLIVQKK